MGPQAAQPNAVSCVVFMAAAGAAMRAPVESPMMARYFESLARPCTSTHERVGTIRVWVHKACGHKIKRVPLGDAFALIASVTIFFMGARVQSPPQKCPHVMAWIHPAFYVQGTCADKASSIGIFRIM